MTAAIVQAFTEPQTARLTDVSVGQLRAWDRTGFYHPSIARGSGATRLYSFRDLLNLRVIATLRNDLGLPLQHLRDVGAELRELDAEDWASVTLYVVKRRVVFDHPRTRLREEVVSGQGIVNIPLETVRGDMRAAIEQEFSRRPDSSGQIEKVRRVVSSEPVIAGTRILVKSVRAFIDDGYSDDDILAEYPSLTREDIVAVRESQIAA